MARLASLAKSLAKNMERKVECYLKEIGQESRKPSPNLPKDFERFNKVIGLPSVQGKSPIIFSYQKEIDSAINEHHKVLINKSRKIGATETVLRSIAKNCFERYAGYNIMIVAGNRQAQAEELLTRFDKLFEKGFVDLDGTKYTYHDIIKKKTKSELVFFNDTRIHTYPAVAEALRGPDRVVCVFLDEAAHFKQLDDSVVYDALKPNLANTNGDFVIVSTPNGRRGIFYNLWKEGTYKKLELPYTLALGNLLSEEYIANEKEDPRIDFEQEYECKFTTTNSPAIDTDAIIYKPEKLDQWEDILGPERVQ